jgi:hypothetical protein
MTRLRACYPQRVADAEHWKAMVARYWEDLCQLDEGLVAEAIEGAWHEHPSFFPSLGELRTLVTKAAKRQAAPARLLTEGASGLSDVARDAIAKVLGQQ